LAFANCSNTKIIKFEILLHLRNYITAAFTAVTGPMPMIEGSTPAWANETMTAIGVSPFDWATFASAKTKAAAPSLIPEAFPAVTVPA
jgi:hypothetical protein